MNEANFVKRIPDFITGDSFLAEREISLSMVRDVTSNLTPFGESTISVGAQTMDAVVPDATADGISFADGETAFLQFMIPQDYAENKDQCALRLTLWPSADSADTTDIGITSAQSIFRPGVAAITTASTAKAETAVASTGRKVREAILDISGRSYQPGDLVKLTLDANGSGTTELVLLGISLIYGSCLRAYNADDNERNL